MHQLFVLTMCAALQATIEAMYLILQAVLYVCVLYFMAGFQKTPGKSPLHGLTYLILNHHHT